MKLNQPLGEKTLIDEKAGHKPISEVIPHQGRNSYPHTGKERKAPWPQMDLGPLISPKEPPSKVKVISHPPLKESLAGI
jgi:hypothetical protein